MNYSDSTRIHKPHPNDGTAMRRYSQTYSYDEVGNLLEVVHTPSSGTGWTRTYTIDSSSNQLDVNSIGSNAPTAETYTYDARGNIITGFNHLDSLTYNEENRLEKVILADTDITCYYQYDGQGQRVRKVTIDDNSNGYTQVRKYIGSWEVYDKIDGNNDVVLQRETLHIMDDRVRVALIDTPVIDDSSTEAQLLRYQFSNHLQTATLELDFEAAIISYEEYYPFGSTSFQSGRSSTEVSRKRYRYTGKERDEETGLYYHGARYYAPWLCRWCAVDPISIESYNHSKGQPQKNLERNFIELTASSYEYCYDNPVRFNDPSGEQVPPSDVNQQMNEILNAKGKTDKDATSAPIKETAQTDNLKPSQNADKTGPSVKEAAHMADNVADSSKQLVGGWHISDFKDSKIKFTDSKTGFNSALYERVLLNGKKEYAYVTQGTNPLSTKDWMNNFNQALAGKSEQYSLSVQNARALNKIFGNQLTFVGHSLGGGMASANALATGRNAITFNAAGLSQPTIENLNLTHNARIDAYVIKGEAVHKSQGMIGLKAEGEMHKLKAPSFYGLPKSSPIRRVANHLMGPMKVALHKQGYR